MKLQEEPKECQANLGDNSRQTMLPWLYVLGRSSLHKSVRSFKLNRIRELKPTERCFVDGDNFDVYDYLGKAWSMIPEGQLYNIKLKFLPEVDGLNEITWWILSYGDKVQVLAPKILRQRIIKIAQRMRSTHQQELTNSS